MFHFSAVSLFALFYPLSPPNPVLASSRSPSKLSGVKVFFHRSSLYLPPEFRLLPLPHPAPAPHKGKKRTVS
ncbi:hypothetical protein OPV22_007474 [Ensete ventricosum]|uniref:Secreted protein n=1 Tax=Ensete ventricosum TaxID=4639 RepID=A0AAV8RRS9_ENSVE|nr:hypothetical protein OPV22_007474 [Ensete ventricosum]